MKHVLSSVTVPSRSTVSGTGQELPTRKRFESRAGKKNAERVVVTVGGDDVGQAVAVEVRGSDARNVGPRMVVNRGIAERAVALVEDHNQTLRSETAKQPVVGGDAGHEVRMAVGVDVRDDDTEIIRVVCVACCGLKRSVA